MPPYRKPSGKTHLAIALGVAACHRGKSVLFRTAMDIAPALGRATPASPRQPSTTTVERRFPGGLV